MSNIAPSQFCNTNASYGSGWIPNTDLLELDFDTIGTVPSSMRKDLQAAHQLAAEKHDLQYFKDILQNFMDQRAAEIAAKEAAKAAKKANKEVAKAKPRKSLSKTVVDEEDDDVEMEDAVAEQDSDGIEIPVEKAKKTKKRKAEDDVAVSSIYPIFTHVLTHSLDPTTHRLSQEAKDQVDYNPKGKRHLYSQGYQRSISC